MLASVIALHRNATAQSSSFDTECPVHNEAVWCCVGEAHLLEYLPNCSQLSFFFISLQVIRPNKTSNKPESYANSHSEPFVKKYTTRLDLPAVSASNGCADLSEGQPSMSRQHKTLQEALVVLVLMYKHCFLCDLTSGCHVLLQQRWLVRGPPAHSRPCFQRSTAVCCSCARACTMSVTDPQQALSAFD